MRILIRAFKMLILARNILLINLAENYRFKFAKLRIVNSGLVK